LALLAFVGAAAFFYPARSRHYVEEMWVPRGYYLTNTSDIDHRTKTRSGEELFALIRKVAPSISADRRTLSDIVYVTADNTAALDGAADITKKNSDNPFQRVFQVERAKTELAGPLLISGFCLAAWCLFWFATWTNSFRYVFGTVVLFSVALALSWGNYSRKLAAPPLNEVTLTIVSDSNDVFTTFPEIFKRLLLKIHTSELIKRHLENDGYFCAYDIQQPPQNNNIASGPGSTIVILKTNAPERRVLLAQKDALQIIARSGEDAR